MKRLTGIQWYFSIAGFILLLASSAATQTGIVGLTIDSGGNVGIGTTSPTAGLEIDKGDTNNLALRLTSSGNGWGSGMRFYNSTGVKEYGIYVDRVGTWRFADVGDMTDRITIDKNGKTTIINPSFTNVSYGDKGNLQYDIRDGQLHFDNSSERYKQNIKPLEDDFNRLLDVKPKTYTRPGFPEIWEIGYVAEDFEKLGLTRLLRYDKEGRPDSINYTKMGLYLAEILKKHDRQIKHYERKASKFEAEVGRLRATVEALTATQKQD
jgi:hypothetical protein